MSDIKPCPFCGGEAERRTSKVRCSSWDCEASRVYIDADIWNCRVVSPAVRALVEACRNVAGSAFWRDGAELPSVTTMREALAAVEKEIDHA